MEHRNIDAAALIHQQAYNNNFRAFVEGKATPDAAARSMQLLGPWHGVTVLDLTDPPDEATARQALSMVAPGQRHSTLFVLCLRAAQKLGDTRIPFLRNFLGLVNWDALFQRQIAVFEAAGITIANTPWQQHAAGSNVGEPQHRDKRMARRRRGRQNRFLLRVCLLQRKLPRHRSSFLHRAPGHLASSHKTTPPPCPPSQDYLLKYTKASLRYDKIFWSAPNDLPPERLSFVCIRNVQ